MTDYRICDDGTVDWQPAQTLILPPLTTLNQYIDAERRNKYVGAKIKKMDTETVAWIAKSTLKPVDRITGIIITFYVTNKRTDKDNLIFSTKFILDGLVMAGIIKGDGWKFTPDNWHYYFKIAEQPRIEVRLNDK